MFLLFSSLLQTWCMVDVNKIGTHFLTMVARNIRFLSLFSLFRCLSKGAFRLILWHLNANDMSKNVGISSFL